MSRALLLPMSSSSPLSLPKIVGASVMLSPSV